jgi:hypothetical protein
MYVCPECAHEWPQQAAEAADQARVVKDAYGNVLTDGDSVTLIKDLKVKGSSSVLKVGEVHPPGRGRPRHRLSHRRLRRDAAEVGVREEGLSKAMCAGHRPAHICDQKRSTSTFRSSIARP